MSSQLLVLLISIDFVALVTLALVIGMYINMSSKLEALRLLIIMKED